MKIAIAGYGIEGKSSYNYFAAQGHAITILDQRSEIADVPEGAQAIMGEHAFDDLAAFDMVIRTPSLPPARLRGAKTIWSATNEFFAKCPAPIIGVTGTKGKGTTSSLIASILEKSGKKVHLVGNIGKPALEALDSVQTEDVVVYELSSFQLWDIEKSPHIAVVLMIEPDHLDVHATFDEYIHAKQNIVRFQTENDIIIFNAENTYSSEITAISKALKIPIPTNETVHVTDGFFWYGEQRLCPVESLKIPGSYHLHNASAAIAATWPYVKDGEVIAAGLGSFAGLPHRLNLVRKINGVSYYDNSIATTVGSVVADIKAFKQPKIIILGGSSKGIVDFEAIADASAKFNVKKAILIGEQAPKIQEALVEYKVPFENLGSNTTMSEVVRCAQQQAQPGDIVLLSPGCASYDMFKSYADRGDQFVRAVNEL